MPNFLGHLNRRPFLVEKKGMRALSIRQPYAELILRGIPPGVGGGSGDKTIDYRRRATRIVGEEFYSTNS